MQRHTCRTLLSAVRTQETQQGREVHQALAQLAAFPPPPLTHSRGRSQSGQGDSSLGPDQRGYSIGAPVTSIEKVELRDEVEVPAPSQSDADVAELRLVVARLSAEAERLRAEKRGNVQPDEDSYMLEAQVELREERRRHLEQMQFLQERLDAAEGIAKELVVKLASVGAVCSGAPAALAQQQAEINATLDAYMPNNGVEALPGGRSRVHLEQSYSYPLFPGWAPSPQDSATTSPISLSRGAAPARNSAASTAAVAVANAMAAQTAIAQSRRGRSQSQEESELRHVGGWKPPQRSRSPTEESMVRLAREGLRSVGTSSDGAAEAGSAAQQGLGFLPAMIPSWSGEESQQAPAGHPAGQGMSWPWLGAAGQGAAPPENDHLQEISQAYSLAIPAGITQEGILTEPKLEIPTKSLAPPPIMVNGASHLLSGGEPGTGSPLVPQLQPSWQFMNPSPALSRDSSPISRTRDLPSTAPAMPAGLRPPLYMGSDMVAAGGALPMQAPTLQPLTLTPPTRMRALSGAREATPPPLFFTSNRPGGQPAYVY